MPALEAHSCSYPWSRRLGFFALAGVVVAGAALASAGPAAAAPTVVNGASYTGNVVWTKAGSPYVLNGGVNVAAGATLTIEPGVVVKLNGATVNLLVKGTLRAVGTPGERIVFTSYKDDTVAGDTNGDGVATSGAPGQWYRIQVSGEASTASELRYVTVRYGGNGSGALRGHGALYAYGGAKATVSQSLFEHNKYYAVRAATASGCTTGSCVSEVSVDSSVLFGNGGGVSTVNAAAHLRRSVVASNVDVGAIYMLQTSYRGPASEVMDSDISENGSFGVWLSVDDTSLASVPTEHWPHGNRNNIWQNNQASTTLAQLYGTSRRAVDWTDNFWGSGTVFRENPLGCLGRGYAAGRVRYPSATDDPTKPASGPGPISSQSSHFTENGTYTFCYSDDYDVGPCEFVTARRFHRDGRPDPEIDPRDLSSGPPPLSVSGSLWDARCGTIDGASYTLEAATDPAPGPSNVAIFLDGAPIVPEGAPPASARTWTFDAASAGGGVHEVRVEATDHLNRTSEQKFTVEIPDRAPPALEPLEGTLYNARNTTVRGDQHTLHVEASDQPGLSGLEHIEIKAGSFTVTVPSGTDWAFSDAVHGPSTATGATPVVTPYAIEVTAIDNAGNRSATRTFQVNWSSKPCNGTPLT